MINNDSNPAAHLAINNKAMVIDTEIFSGRIEIHLKGLKTTKKEIFDGKKRFFQIAVQVGRGSIRCSTSAV